MLTANFVQGTNDFNTVSKCSMARNGYFKDDYVPYFVSKCNRRTPLIHLGYYMRVLTIDFTLRSFLEELSAQSAQIVSCGAGFDTSFFRLAANSVLHPNVRFFEIDFKEVVERKTECIRSSKPLQDCIGPYEVNQNGAGGLVGSQYHLVACDLQVLDKLESSLKLAGVNFSLPTLLLAECAICYMDEASASSLIEWAASKFEDSTFVTYEQVYPNDGFGIVMQKHFEDMNSPLLSLTKFPDLESQEERYTSRRWESCNVWTALDMFQQILSPGERKKIVSLEPFDELEEWHLEGCHFALMVASKGNLTDWFLKYADVPQRPIGMSERPHVEWELVETLCRQPICRFAQKSVKVTGNNCCDILIIGGFGPSAESLHGRRHEVINIYSRKEQHMENESTSAVGNNLDVEDVIQECDVKLDMLHHTCTRLSLYGPDGATRIMVYGGRYSPCRAVNSWPVILTVVKCETGLCIRMEKSETASIENAPQARWRHSAVCLIGSSSLHAEDHVAVFGGRTSDFRVLQDLHVWTVNASDLKISCREVTDCSSSSSRSWPSARFSHSAAVWRKSSMVVTGGLGEELMPFNDVWCFSLESETWSKLTVDGMLPRYSHTSAIYEDKLVLIGGVNTLPGNQPGVCVVDLNTTSCCEYTLPMQDSMRPIMLHNHTSELIDSTTIVTIGGGGNCFSFGTVFNNCIVKINAQQFR
ncbi:tRNA wybutosine-synthesizing protein 4-like isoform X2 [Periplaneta americana]|uniref:tRNA wybutosine-synthesizing protein 4-like isoform X2 n=1 Tax=Periplaneta americana TaxID=6978 RepID=UPI0037E7D7AE